MDKTDNTKFLTSEFRVSHPHVFKPSAIIKGSDDLRYSIEMLFDKKTTDLSSLQKPIRAACIAKWGPDKNDWPEGLKKPIRDGDIPKLNKKTKKKEVKPEHKGCYVVRASTKAEYGQPHVVGRDPKVPLENESEFYPGCYARAHLKAFAYEFADKVGISFALNGVQFIRDGEALGGKLPADQVFGIVEGDDGEDMESFDNLESDDEDAFL